MRTRFAPHCRILPLVVRNISKRRLAATSLSPAVVVLVVALPLPGRALDLWEEGPRRRSLAVTVSSVIVGRIKRRKPRETRERQGLRGRRTSTAFDISRGIFSGRDNRGKVGKVLSQLMRESVSFWTADSEIAV